MMTTESSSNYNDLEKMSVREILTSINREDQTVPHAVQKSLPQIEALVEQIVPRMQKGAAVLYWRRNQRTIGSCGCVGMPADIRCAFRFGSRNHRRW